MSNFKAGDKVKVKHSDRVFTIGVVQPGAATGKPIAWEYAADGTTTIGAGLYFEEIEHVVPEPKFKVGDRVIANTGIYKNEEFTVTDVVDSKSSLHGPYYYRGDPKEYGVWGKFLTLAPREFRVGDLIRAEKDEVVIQGRLVENKWTNTLVVREAGWGLKSLQEVGFTVTLVEAAPEPVVDPFPLPEEDGLYISQVYSLFRRTGDEWLSVGSGQRVNLETLKSEKHWPLGLIAEPVGK